MGTFLMSEMRKRTTRAPVNPLDKSTVVSIFPKFIAERKHTIQPGYFEIQPGTYHNPSILVVGPSSWWKEVDENQPLLEIPHSSIQVADSIVRDYNIGMLACDMADNVPGLFFVPGAKMNARGDVDIPGTLKWLKDEHKDKLEMANTKQRNWFAALVKMADALWSRSNGNPMTISDDMKLAARELGFEDKDWLKDTQAMELVRCPGCGSMKNPVYPICPNCKLITDPEKAKGMQFAQ